MEAGLTFSDLFAKIVAGAHPRLSVVEELSHSCLEKVFVGQSKDSLSFVDERLVVEDVCRAFGQHVKFCVSRHETTEASKHLRNAFTVLMNSQRALDAGKKLPPKIIAKTKKDELFNDLVSLFEKEGWSGLGMENQLEESLLLHCRTACGMLMGIIKLLPIEVIPFLPFLKPLRNTMFQNLQITEKGPIQT